MCPPRQHPLQLGTINRNRSLVRVTLSKADEVKRCKPGLQILAIRKIFVTAALGISVQCPGSKPAFDMSQM